jgi:hypothetical protein
MKLTEEFFKTLFKELIPKYSTRAYQLWLKERIAGSILIGFGLAVGVIFVGWLDSSHIGSLNDKIELGKERLESTKERCDQNLKINESMNKALSYTIEHKDIQAVKTYYDQNGKEQLTNMYALDAKTLIEGDTKETKTPPSEEDLAKQQSSQPDSPELNDRMSTQALATCLLMASNTYQVPAAVLIGIMHVEGGRVGEEREEKNGNTRLGIYLIDAKQTPTLADKWKVTEDTAYTWVRDNACVNVHVAAWILRQKIVEEGTLMAGVAKYHSKNTEAGNKYAEKVVSVMEAQGLVQHEAQK